MPATYRTYQILVVEDNEGDRHLIVEAFKECGLHCVLSLAGTVSSALELLREHGFDLIITDMSVPNGEAKSGLIETVRSDNRWKATPIIVLSGAYNALPAYEAGANAFISKSMDMDEFFERIRALMRFWTEVAELPRPSQASKSKG
ncbi:MAG: response regulator [Acidobacteriaceae bacterium]|nr:response regulator [Acidobacteriaceae bacterium]MBV9441964.1 response regulator [Acidobacteriaceae bacterium]